MLLVLVGGFPSLSFAGVFVDLLRGFLCGLLRCFLDGVLASTIFGCLLCCLPVGLLACFFGCLVDGFLCCFFATLLADAVLASATFLGLVTALLVAAFLVEAFAASLATILGLVATFLADALLVASLLVAPPFVAPPLVGSFLVVTAFLPDTSVALLPSGLSALVAAFAALVHSALEALASEFGDSTPGTTPLASRLETLVDHSGSTRFGSRTTGRFEKARNGLGDALSGAGWLRRGPCCWGG